MLEKNRKQNKPNKNTKITHNIPSSRDTCQNMKKKLLFLLVCFLIVKVIYICLKKYSDHLGMFV